MASGFTNRLAKEASPYLLQHAHNPVDWYAWGPEAFAAARQRQCPIFLSVGYSTCYWCHVMERESFEDEQTAALMNRHFVNIKVDREERPDVDQLYMTAVQLLTHSGGWPMNLFLTPALKPFYGGTYFPPQDLQGRPGFATLLAAVHDLWTHRREEVERSAAQLVESLVAYGGPRLPERPLTLDAAFIDTLIGTAVSAYDSRHGGFGGSPKFPQQTLLDLLLSYCRWNPAGSVTARLRQVLVHSLDAMARGGIRDQLGGGFHRYSTDARWLVPHFEIMLYDNALLAPLYAEMWRDVREPFLAEVARGICDFVLRKMTHAGGGFYTAFDAEVDAREGEPYLWTMEEIAAVLPADDAGLFCRAYGLADGPNFADPHHGSGRLERNVLYLPHPFADVAASEGLPENELQRRLAQMRSQLLAAREQRKQPALDTKILTSWNALMIRGLARCAVALDEPRYLAAARRGADYLLSSHRHADGSIIHSRRSGDTPLAGTLEDYAFLGLSLLSLHDASGETKWRDAAVCILEEMQRRFGGDGACYSTAVGEPDIIVRQQVGVDSPLPSGNGAAALAWLLAGRPERAKPIVSEFAASLEQQGESMGALALAALYWVQHHGVLVVPAGRAPARAGGELQAQDVVQAELLKKGESALVLRLKVREGWHLAGNEPAEGLQPTEVIPTGALASSVAGITYPSAATYVGTVEIELRLSSVALPEAEVVFTCQPCSDQACLSVMRQTVRLG